MLGMYTYTGGMDGGGGRQQRGSLLVPEDLEASSPWPVATRGVTGKASPKEDNGGVKDPVAMTSWMLGAGTKEGQLARAQRAIEDLARERDSAMYRVKQVSQSRTTTKPSTHL